MNNDFFNKLHKTLADKFQTTPENIYIIRTRPFKKKDNLVRHYQLKADKIIEQSNRIIKRSNARARMVNASFYVETNTRKIDNSRNVLMFYNEAFKRCQSILKFLSRIDSTDWFIIRDTK